MATCELKGELKYRDGQTNKFAVKSDNNLKSIIIGVKKLHSEISEVLTSLVEQEKGLNGNGREDSRVDDEEEDDGDEQEDPAETATVNSNAGPPAKRVKTRS
ncbi:uncharacterized protein si:dkeyp-55f12.3 [Electrophorus electricus]|uniref:Uncharacterized protein n=1 Tax=Electrophorus electricus TaxID=8005 RepID=A0A4W4FIJ0_ELEEL|nr:uncharacterized protein si:dkeyp-55f12.3 [Electrophorus electricus]